MKMTRLIFGIIVLVLLVISCQEKKTPKLLVFSKTEGFRHESIKEGKVLFKKLGEENGFEVDVTEDAESFTTKKLKNFAAVVFLNTTGDVLNTSQELEFQRYIQAGGGYIGVHAAADTEYDWPWYGALVGAYFSSHPNNPNVLEATVNKTEHQHVSTTHLKDNWDRKDEWYNYKSISKEIIPILTLDETSYKGGTNKDYHPIAWYHEYDGGRAFYTGGGHTDESFSEEDFVQHLLGGIIWAMGGNTPLDYNRSTVMPEENRFVKEELDNYFNEPMELDLLPDGRIVFIERKGAIKVYSHDTKETTQVGFVEVYSGEEDGLLGLAIDPNYSTNKHIFLCYSNPDETHQRISRFTFNPDIEKALSDEVVVLTVPTQRDECCHSAGSLEFDHKGYLWASFGDNTNPHHSSGHNPIDERIGRYPYDAQKSSANTNDLRGGIIRIEINEDGTYAIPEGNLFPSDGSKGRPEIYVMGCRNPFRFSIDSETNNLYWGDVGPDAQDDQANRGPRGYDEVNQAKGPGFFGWPYFIGNNKSYYEYDFSTEKSLEKFEPLKPINNSPNNTGLKQLPPAQEAMVWYPYARSEEFPLMGTGSRNAMAGPVYHAELYNSPNKYPAYYDDKFFMYDWMRSKIMAVTFDEKGDYKSMEPFIPSIKWNNLMDIVMSPEGDFYTLEYGTGWFTANQNAILSHLKFIPGNRTPRASFVVSENAGGIPFEVSFDASSSVDPDGDNLEYSWDFGDGSKDKGEKISHTYEKPGSFKPVLTINDSEGQSVTYQLGILAGNTPPVVQIEVTGNQDFYFADKGFNYKVVVTDKEDGLISNDNIAVTVDYLEMGHDVTTIAQGHMALSELKSSHLGMDVISKSDCVSCHKLNGKSKGPSYTKISNKYLIGRKSKHIAYLAKKITNGGSGVWGETAMAAHPDIKEKEAASIADYILSISRQEPKVELPASGIKKLAIPNGMNPGGKFVVMASYTDLGANDVESLRSFSRVVLKDPMMSATEFSSVEEASKFTVTPEIVPGIKEEFDIVMVGDKALVAYNAIDLTDISEITILGSAPMIFAAGGTMTLFLDDLESAPIHSAELKASMQLTAISPMTIPLTNQSGKHDIILRFQSAKEGAPVGFITQLIFSSN